jgi:hypothetical protein
MFVCRAPPPGTQGRPWPGRKRLSPLSRTIGVVRVGYPLESTIPFLPVDDSLSLVKLGSLF